MVGVTKKEVSQMTKYYLKMDNIMKNMFVVALNDADRHAKIKERKMCCKKRLFPG